jgi:demethylmenaquinone methyltransferase / 2-methoxy-6-polyprenyl-1,4-benzoquinol methylase
MANKYYEPGEQRAARVRDLFAGIAPRYDLINDLQSFGLHRWWKRRLFRLVAARPGDRVLDVCCGTGDVAFRLSTSGAHVVGVDFSGPMLEVARARADHSASSVAFINGDAMRLPFADAQFDVVTVSYGLRNLADVEAGLREMHRVARPGARLLVLDFGKPQQRLLRSGYFAYLEHAVPIFGRLFCRDAAAYSYILESLRNYPAQEGIAAMMEKLRCTRIRILNLMGGIMSINYGQKAG